MAFVAAVIFWAANIQILCNASIGPYSNLEI